MPISDYLRGLRAVVGPRLLLVPGVAAIVRDAGGRVLLVQSAEGGAWSLPAGAIDPGEAPEAAVVREVGEETGLEVVSARLVAAVGGAPFRVRYPNGDEVEYTVCVFECAVRPAPPRGGGRGGLGVRVGAGRRGGGPDRPVLSAGPVRRALTASGRPRGGYRP